MRWYNDSKATTPHAASVAIRAFDRVVLIAGGLNKGLDLAPMAAEAARVTAVVAIGEAAPVVGATFAGAAPVVTAASMAEAVERAGAAARPGDVVLLSPGCASFDWYPDGGYPARGDDFRRLVQQRLTTVSSGAAMMSNATMTTTTIDRPSGTSVADRRRAALERLHGGPDRVPVRRRARRTIKRPVTTDRPGLWDVQRGPAPAAYYVIGIVVAVFVMLGLVMVLSASASVEAAKGNSPYHIFNRQVTWAGIGLVGMLVGMRMHLAWVQRLAIPLFVLAGLGMALPFLPEVGSTVNDAKAWVTIGSFSLQPSEFLKLALVVFAADLLVRRADVLSDVRRSLRPIALVAMGAAGACLAQGDLGSAIVMCAIVLAVAFIGGVPLSPMLATGLAAGVAALGFVFSTAYRYDRFTAFLDITGHRDRLSYQTYQGFLSIADGGLTGSGVGAGNGKLGYLPLAHSDFIFAVIADELGLVGSVAVVGGFMLLVWFGIQAALAAPDRFGMLLAGGIAAWFGVQAVINLGGVDRPVARHRPDPAVLLRRRVVAVRLDDRRRAAAERRPPRRMTVVRPRPRRPETRRPHGAPVARRELAAAARRR